MARKPSTEPTDAELRILNCLWSQGALRLSEIAAALRQSGDALANTTIATTLKVMSEKKLAKRVKRDGNVVWLASISRDKANSGSVERLLDRLFDGSASKLVAHLVSGGRLSDGDRAEIEQLLQHEPGENAEGGQS